MNSRRMIRIYAQKLKVFVFKVQNTSRQPEQNIPFCTSLSHWRHRLLPIAAHLSWNDTGSFSLYKTSRHRSFWWSCRHSYNDPLVAARRRSCFWNMIFKSFNLYPKKRTGECFCCVPNKPPTISTARVSAATLDQFWKPLQDGGIPPLLGAIKAPIISLHQFSSTSAEAK